MNDDLKLGFHRLGRRFEDPADLFILAAGLWALLAMMISIVVVLGFSGWLLLTAAGVAVLFAFRGRLADLAADWRSTRVELEQRRTAS